MQDTSFSVFYTWTGRERETGSHLQYNRGRYYDPAIGRWISEDPIGFAAGDANLYRYVGNSPTNFTDPSGLARLRIDLLAQGGGVAGHHLNDADMLLGFAQADVPNLWDKINQRDLQVIGPEGPIRNILALDFEIAFRVKRLQGANRRDRGFWEEHKKLTQRIDERNCLFDNVVKAMNGGQPKVVMFWFDRVNNAWNRVEIDLDFNVIAQINHPDMQIAPRMPGGDGGGNNWLDKLQFGLELLGNLPGIGEFADLANGTISLARGDYLGAMTSYASAVPIAGNFVSAGRMAAYAAGATGAVAMAVAGSRRLATAVKPYEVGLANALKNRSLPFDGLDIHHVGQSHALQQLIPGYNPKMAPAIAVPERMHELIPKLTGNVNLSPRQLLANDIRNLRKYTNAPNSALKELIQLNRTAYPGVF